MARAFTLSLGVQIIVTHGPRLSQRPYPDRTDFPVQCDFTLDHPPFGGGGEGRHGGGGRYDHNDGSLSVCPPEDVSLKARAH